MDSELKEKIKQAKQQEDPPEELLDEIVVELFEDGMDEILEGSCTTVGCYVEYECPDCHITFEQDESGDFSCPKCRGDVDEYPVHFCMSESFETENKE
jgi:hypothetical protein